MKNELIAMSKFSDMTLDCDEVNAVAELICAALPEFYDAIPGGGAARLKVITDQFKSPDTECYDPLVLTQDKTIVGAAAVYPVAEIAQRQHQSMMHIMRQMDRDAQKSFRKTLKAKKSIQASIDSLSGQYIARIAISQTSRGAGLGATLLAQIAKTVPNEPILLHVDKTNVRAIAFYKAQGFAFEGDMTVDKLVMQRPPLGK